MGVMTKHEQLLWSCYQRSRSIPDRNVLVEHYLPDLPCICRSIAAKRGRVALDEAISDATLRLITCVEQWRPECGTAFRTYLYRGITMDRVPASWVSMSAVQDELVAPTIESTSERMEDLRAMYTIIMRSKRYMDTVVAAFPKQQQKVFQLLFSEGMTNKEAACHLKLTRGRVAQLRARVLARIRKALGVSDGE